MRLPHTEIIAYRDAGYCYTQLKAVWKQRHIIKPSGSGDRFWPLGRASLFTIISVSPPRCLIYVGCGCG